MDISQIEEFFYSRASQRIGKRITKSNLKNADIYKPDEKQISRIVNNTRGKNNRFLICDAVISNSYMDDETGKYKDCGLLHTPQLHFRNTKEILWGKNEEIRSYLYDLFGLLWEEASNDSLYDIDFDLYLCDYIPYAKNRAYWNIIFSRDKYPALFYGFSEDEVIQNIDSSREESIAFLYNRCEKDFYKRFLSFTKKQESFHKLDKIIKDVLVENVFIPTLTKHKPTSSSLGLRVKDIIYADISHCAPLVANKTYDYPLRELLNASTQYILKLEKIQKKAIKKENGTD